jgi:hypothetical protein
MFKRSSAILAAGFLAGCALRADNPIIKTIFTADPGAMVSGGRVYLYTGHDEAPVGGTTYVMRDWRVYSSANLTSWIDHGSRLSVSAFSWARADAWASHVVERAGKFYWYVTLDHRTIPGRAIGVAVSNSPTGPFTDARGTALITNNMTTQTSIFHDDIDPAVFIDTNGQAYIYWGNTVLKYARLKSNMIELDGAINVISVSSFTEAPWVHKRGSTYYLSYARGWPEQIAYATASSPTGPWTYRGVITEPNILCGTNHQAIVEFNGRSYFIYHTAALASGGDYRRSVAVEELFYNADGTIRPIQQTSTGLDGVKQRLQSYNFTDRYVRHANFDARIDPNVSPLMDSQWKIVQGLSNTASGYVSFESVNVPGFYLRHVNFDFQLAKNDGSTAFKADATFRRVAGLANSSAVSFQSANFPDRYLRHAASLLKLETISGATAQGDATFRIVP